MGKVVVAGAGPVGALTAILLAKQGYSVDVFEKRSCPEAIPPSTDTKAYLLNLNFRAFEAFKQAGVSSDALLERCNGRSEFTFRDAKGRQIGGVDMPVTPANPTMIRVYRDEISRHLIDEAKRLHPEAITFHFEAGIIGADLDKRVVSISGQGPTEMQYDLLVGADGAGSVIRSELQKVMPPGFLSRRAHDAVYATGPLEIKNKEDFPKHTFTTMDSFHGGAVMVYGRGNGDIRLGLFLDKTGSERLKEGDDSWVQKALDTTMPLLSSDARASAKRFAAHAPKFSSISGWTYLSQFHGPRVVLLGDAAHTMTPVLGQGCNSGLEDASIFATILREQKDFDTALPAFTDARLPDIQALVALNEVVASGRFNTVVTGKKGSLLYKAWILAHTAVLSTQHARLALHKKAPSLFGLPPLYQAVTGLSPFRNVMPAAYFDSAAVLALGSLLTGAVYIGLRKSLSTA